MNNKESDDIFRAFFKAGVPEMGTPTDLALAETLYRMAEIQVNHVLEGHSFLTEGFRRLGKLFRWKIHKNYTQKFGAHKMSTYPLMTFFKFMKWLLCSRIKKVRPYWYLDYSKEEARAFFLERNVSGNIVVGTI